MASSTRAERPGRSATRPKGTLSALLAIGVVALAGCADDGPSESETVTDADDGQSDSAPVADGATGDWPSFGFDHRNTLHNPDETVLSPDNVGELVESWRIDGDGVSGTPIVLGGVVYFADWGGAVHAVESSDGTAIWDRRVTDVPISATVAVTESLVIAGDLGGVLHAIDRETGDLRWSATLEPRGASLFASPVIVEDTVVIGMTDTELRHEAPDFRASVVAVGLDDGAERWRFHTGPDDSEYWVSVWSTIAHDPDRGLIFVGTGDTNQPGGGGPGSSAERAPTDLPLADGVLALEDGTGELVWFFKLVPEDRQRDFDVGAAPNLLTVDGRDVVSVGGKSGEFVMLDRETGEMIWKTELTGGSALGGVMSTAAIGDGVIYVASNDGGSPGIVFALDATDGSIRWQSKVGPPIVGSMALANGVLYRGTFSPTAATVFAWDATDGTRLWEARLDGRLAGGFAVADGALFVGYGADDPRQIVRVDGGLVKYTLP